MMLVLNLIASAVVFGFGLFGAINNMSRNTRHGIRLAWLALTTGALAVLLGPLYGYVDPRCPEVLLNCGIALFVATTRRRNADYRRPT